MKKRAIYQTVFERLEEPRRYIQVLLGPRQVGKTTLAIQASEALHKPYHYVSADLATLQDLAWLEQNWEIGRQKAKNPKGALLIIDEVQKIPHWSETIKSLWDSDTRHHINLSVMILGSSPWLMQKGLSESLAGRFEVIPVTHWSFEEMHRVFKWDIEEYLYFGGYPGAAPLANKDDPTRWIQYINDSLIETTISRDILLMTQVNKPVLLRRLFQLGCNYSGQLLSYNKMLGELEGAGNTTTLAHYLDLLSGAGLLQGLQKYAQQKLRQKGSIPKFAVLNTALMSAQAAYNFHDAKKDRAYWGRLYESAVGAYLLNSIRGTQMELFYWREGDKEVDFILKYGKNLVAIEVKSNHEKIQSTGIDLFIKHYKPHKVLLIGEQGIPLKDFLLTPVTEFMN